MQNDQKIEVASVEATAGNFAKHNPSAVSFPVPQGVKLYLRPFTDNSYLLRVQNFNLDQATVSVPSGWTVTELTLSANQLQEDWKKAQYKWNTESSSTEVILPVREGEEEEVEEQGFFDWIVTST